MSDYLKHRREQKNGDKPEKQKKIYSLKRTGIKKRVSEKLKIEREEYSALRIDFLIKHPKCQVCIDRIKIGSDINPTGEYKIRDATDVHHKKGRGRFLLVVEFFLPVCRVCHDWIERNPKKALELGYSQHRNKN